MVGVRSVLLYFCGSCLSSVAIIFIVHDIVTVFSTLIAVVIVTHAVAYMVYLQSGCAKFYSTGKLIRTRDAVLSSLLLGHMMAIGIIILCIYPPAVNLGLYAIALSAFHLSEFLVTYLTNPANLSIDSFLLNHSVEYWIAATASWVEYGVELFFIPTLKLSIAIPWALCVGVAMIVTGEVVRKLAMFTAGTNFSHLVRYRHTKGHRLVTTGVFAYVRHPSYLGWFLWSVGTQVLLANPICLIGYAVVTWTFFSERIVDEEMTLVAFFGKEYQSYQDRVPRTGIPAVKGYHPSK